MTCVERDELQDLILEHLRRSKEPVSDLYFQHRLNADYAEISFECVTRAINRMIESKLVTVANTLVIDCVKVLMLPPLAQPISETVLKPVSEDQRRRVRGPLSDETKLKISEAHRGRKISEATRLKISESHRRRYAASKAIGIAPTP